jgi:hypothetical protein
VSAFDWQAFYGADWQFPFGVMAVPFAFLVYRAIARERREDALDAGLAPFVSLWVTLFTLVALLDPLATGPLARALGSRAESLLGFTFVLLGDFRVYWLALRFRAPAQTGARAAREALALSLPAPAIAGLASLALGTGQAMWLTHELVSLALAFALARLAAPVDPRRAAFVRSALGFFAAHYALWAAADVLILAGVDAGWAVRLVPNQLYYGFLVPFVWSRFFAARASDEGA